MEKSVPNPTEKYTPTSPEAASLEGTSEPVGPGGAQSVDAGGSGSGDEGRAGRAVTLPPHSLSWGLGWVTLAAGAGLALSAVVAAVTLEPPKSAPLPIATVGGLVPTELAARPVDDVADASDAAADAGDDAEAIDAGPPRPSVFRVARLAGEPGLELVRGTLGKRPMIGALEASGLSAKEAKRVAAGFAGVRPFERPSPRDTFAFAKDKTSGRVVAFEFATSNADVWQERESVPGASLKAEKLELTVTRGPVAVGIAIGDDLRGSLVKAGLDDDMLAMLDEALHGRVDLAAVRPGSRFRVVASEERVDGEFASYPELLALEYVPQTGAPLRIYHFDPPPSRRGRAHANGYFDVKGQRPYHGAWRSPVPLARISSRYNPLRKHPVLHVVMPHNGVDFAAAPGTPVYSTATGVVKSAGDSGPCGNMVQVEHANGLVSAYCHLSRFAAGVRSGLHVEARQLIGYVGQTGRATGPHLHFAIKRGERFLDPLSLRLDGVVVVEPSDREAFAQHRAELDVALDAIALPAPIATDAGAGTDLGDADGGAHDIIYDETP
ncbi:MAG: M23 family metallopeptidase [Polyangiaceae bacterium]